MILAGKKDEARWGEGRWIFLDVGFSNKTRSCGLAFEDGAPMCLQFSTARQRIFDHLVATESGVNLLIEAPLSVAFDAKGNPTGRSVEKDMGRHRYWYEGPGAVVMVATMYLVRAINDAQIAGPIRLFEGLMSYKDRGERTSHEVDVHRLREVVQDPIQYADSILGADALKRDPDDVLTSAFCVLGLDCGVPAVIRR